MPRHPSMDDAILETVARDYFTFQPGLISGGYLDTGFQSMVPGPATSARGCCMPDLLTQKPWGQDQGVCVFTELSGDSDACSRLRTTGLEVFDE